MARRGSKLSESHRLAIAAGMRRAIESGYRPNTLHWRVGLAAITPEAKQRGAEAAALTNKGVPQRMDTAVGKHTNNIHAKWWKFYNKALGKTIEGKNLNQLLRDNVELFSPADLRWVGPNCNAGQCLRGLQSKKEPRHSWKGWMLGTPIPRT